MRILALDYTNICDDGKRIFLVDQRVCRPPENYIRNKSLFLIRSSMLSNWHSDSVVVVWEVGSKILISKHNIHSYNCILWVLSSLQKHIYIDVLNCF